MYITFRNNSTSEKMIVSVEAQKHIINPESSVEVFCRSPRVTFVAEVSAFDELTNAIDELDSEYASYKLKDKILAKLSKKFAEKLTEMMLNVVLRYEADFDGYQSAVIDLFDGAYSVFDGNVADFFDMMPVAFAFCRAETEGAEIRVLDADAANRKKYLKLMRNILLFSNWGLFFVDLFFAIPEYLTVKLLSSHFYLKRLFCSLYNKPADERARILYKKELMYEKEDNKGCLSGLLKGLVVLLILGGLCWWAMTSDPDVIISEDFQSVVYFDETFVKIDGGLPEDAEDVFLEDYTAYYPLADGEYDMDNYYCYIYETPDGTRYMWLKDDCDNEENADKAYADYENPLVYKSIGEVEDGVLDAPLTSTNN